MKGKDGGRKGNQGGIRDQVKGKDGGRKGNQGLGVLKGKDGGRMWELGWIQGGIWDMVK